MGLAWLNFHVHSTEHEQSLPFEHSSNNPLHIIGYAIFRNTHWHKQRWLMNAGFLVFLNLFLYTLVFVHKRKVSRRKEKKALLKQNKKRLCDNVINLTRGRP